ncbi:MAG: phosphoenolpyruvate--protein phosphotransferase [Succinivibrionaceae bacterium]
MLTLLRRIIESVSAAGSLSEAMQNLVVKTKESLNVDCCSVYLFEPEHNCLRLEASDGLLPEAVGKITLPFGDGLVGLVAKRLELINLADATSHPNFKYIPEVGEDCYKSFLGVPIVDQRSLLGILVIQQKTSRKFDKSDESFMVTLAAQLAAKVSQAQLKSKLKPNQSFSGYINGIASSKGEAMAKSFVWYPQLDLEQIVISHTDDVFTQTELFNQAIFQVQLDLDTLMLRLNQTTGNKESSEIFDMYSSLLNDASFSESIINEIQQKKLMAVSAVKIVCEELIQQYRNKSDKYLQERALDVRDVAQRLLVKLAHNQSQSYQLNVPIILVAQEVTASLLIEIPRNLLRGVVSLKGSVNSHALIMARALNIPAVTGVDLPIDELKDRILIVDGTKGAVIVDPDMAVQSEYEQIIQRKKQLEEMFEQEVQGPVTTIDGERVHIGLNAGLQVDSEKKNFVDAVGLYRSEISFLMQSTFPTEQEQQVVYGDFLSSFRDVPVCMRTLDVGGDKQLPYLAVNETNPALGWRGIRLSLDNQSLFTSQLRAMLRANINLNNLSIMIPMVTNVQEVIDSRKILDDVYREVSEEHKGDGVTVPYPQFGAMIEVPSLIFIMEEVSNYVDFFSIGTNDLTQYILAVDRSNPKVSSLFTSYHPAVLRVLKNLKIKADSLGKFIAVCGEMAGDPLGILIMLGFGYREFSMNLSGIAKIKYLLRRVDAGKIRDIVSASDLSDIGRLRSEIKAYLAELNLDNLI